jgi:IS30 family transposase
LWCSLRRRGNRYNNRAGKNVGHGLIPNRIDIPERPAIGARETRLGDWEGDPVVSAGRKGCVFTLVERKTRLTKIAKLPRATARATQKSAVRPLKPFADFVPTIMFDNGKGVATHQDITHALKATIFFATPYHAWERGLNRNTNGSHPRLLSKRCRLLYNRQCRGCQDRTFTQRRDPATPTSIHRKRFAIPSRILKFLCAGYLNSR